MLDAAIARVAGAYALRAYLPASLLARSLRTRLRRLRGKPEGAATRLPQVAWPQVLHSHPIQLAETAKSDGNVRLSELAILALAAREVAPGSEIIEIGTFDGRTALNLAINAPRGVAFATLDLPIDQQPAHAIEQSERQYVDKPAPGARLRQCNLIWREAAKRVVQLSGDSATFDWSAHLGKAALVFVDGSHAYDYAKKDSETALRLVRPGGVVLWHDYGIWPGVAQALEELEAAKQLGLVNIRGTSLVFWRAGQA
jgi:predicted O-methyltransferase YrrM